MFQVFQVNVVDLYWPLEGEVRRKRPDPFSEEEEERLTRVYQILEDTIRILVSKLKFLFSKAK